MTTPEGARLWSGTSFSAPLVAAHIVAALLKGAASVAACGWTTLGQRQRPNGRWPP